MYKQQYDEFKKTEAGFQSRRRLDETEKVEIKKGPKAFRRKE